MSIKDFIISFLSSASYSSLNRTRCGIVWTDSSFISSGITKSLPWKNAFVLAVFISARAPRVESPAVKYWFDLVASMMERV